MTKDPFSWECCPEGEALLEAHVEKMRQRNPFIEELAEQMREKASTRLFDWLDHVIMSEEKRELVEQCGFEKSSEGFYYHPGAMFPKILLDQDEKEQGLAIKADSIANFFMIHGLSKEVEGDPLTGYRRALIDAAPLANLWIIERRGTQTLLPTNIPSISYYEDYLWAEEAWKMRPRTGDDLDRLMEKTHLLAEEMVEALGPDLCAHIVLDVERQYWQARNRAGQWQKNRQDSLGLGWANHDHHTFRSSRSTFRWLVQLFELFGFYCRERFYAGEQAGWGAQVMENPRCGLILFLDVDLEPHEHPRDFARDVLPAHQKLGTVGLWCALHGDSIFEAGMHHLEAQFSFEELKSELEKEGIGMMNPFSNFSYLKQAFSKGEQWPVKTKRVETLFQEGKISEQQAEKFLREGAIGSHLENLQRREGYKGFNKDNVSTIIQATDPRKSL